jgi:hypothetical protein
VADGGEATLYQRFNNGVGPDNGGENLPGPVRCLDIAEANLQMARARLTAANEGRVDAQGDRCGGRCRFSRSGIPQVLANLERLGAQGFGIGPSIKREQLLEHAGCNTVGQEGGKLRPDLVELGSRAALRRPLDPSLIGPTAGTAEAGQSNRDHAEQGGNPAGPIIFDPACGTAGPACRPLGGMIPALGCDHRLLNLAQELLAIRQAQAKIRKVVKVAGAVNLQHVNATQRPLDPGLHQAQYPPHS